MRIILDCKPASVRGATDTQVAAALQLSPRTVELHVAGALRALDCRTRAEAVHRATRLQWLER
jgi:DNA-binding NarL/FixJ family response regulator